MHAEVIIPRNISRLRSTLIYRVPEPLAGILRPGHEVRIPLKTKKISGTVARILTDAPAYPTKDILEIINLQPYLAPWQMRLMLWISDYYACPLYKALELFVPKRILRKHRPPATEEIYPDSPAVPRELHTLTPDQQKILDEILASQKRVSLIHGITGSGKTEIYLHAAKYLIGRGRQVLMLVPEISLTPQTVSYFERIFEGKIAVIHSRLTDTQKTIAWKNIFENQAQVVIGSRSALFAPFQNLGLIIMDEEHEFSYKQDQSPRYHARDVILKIAEFLPEVKVVFGSATPSVETYYRAKNGEFNLLFLTERIERQPLPKISIIDMRDELKKKNYSVFSEHLADEIAQTLNRKEQAILFLNKRGTNSAVICRECGYVAKCKNCSSAMTYHFWGQSSQRPAPTLICHHCGYNTLPPLTCPICKSMAIRFIGSGTEKVENELAKLFPTAKILRADKDTTRKRESFKKIYCDFRDHKADILIGTQLISHGLHLPKVSLVGIMLADIGLLFPDFRAGEKTFQLLTQVAGRAGRILRKNNLADKVIIQTYMPENPILRAVQNYDYEKMYESEISARRPSKYPPFSHLIKLTFSHKDEQECIKAINRAKALLREKTRAIRQTADKGVNIFEISAYPSFWPKIKGKYIYNILIKTLAPNPEIVAPFIDIEGWKIDVDPISTL